MQSASHLSCKGEAKKIKLKIFASCKKGERTAKFHSSSFSSHEEDVFSSSPSSPYHHRLSDPYRGQDHRVLLQLELEGAILVSLSLGAPT